jgi:2-amino-4-hydroxy-6-hydroxymethyldihydropteridine diphosphokinase
VGIGSNVGRRIMYLGQAVAALQKLGDVKCSAVYETTPVDYVDQADFLNMVVCLKTTLSARQMLDVLHQIELSADRKRDIRFGPRTLDLDILLFDDAYICLSDLQIPHPRMWQRAFVLVPLADLVPERRGLGGKTIAVMSQCFDEKDEVRYVGRFW